MPQVDTIPDEHLAAPPDVHRPVLARWARLPSGVRTTLPGAATMLVYWLLSYLNSPYGFLGTDTGGKVATLEAMANNNTFTSVDVGYWAAQWDPTGSLHPLYHTLRYGDQWIQVTTLPMLLLGEPLYRIGGYRLTLLLPMLGGVACAYAARSLARRFGADARRQWWAFWIIALASPVTIYALDFWEHTIGLALMAWGTVALLGLLDAKTGARRATSGVLAGLAFGTAGIMRTEALAYFAVMATAVFIAAMARRRRVLPWIGPAAATVVGAAVPLFANLLLSRWIFGDGLRETRTANAAGGIGSNAGVRLREGISTTFGLLNGTDGAALGFGILAAGLIAWLALRSRRPVPPRGRRLVHVVLICVGILYATVFIRGFGFIPGIVGAAPLAAAGAAIVWRPPPRPAARVAVCGALLALPVIWAVQWTGGAGPQWGGRYVLLTMLVLLVAAVAALDTLERLVTRSLVGLSVAVTVFGLVWMSIRTHDIERTFRTLHARPEPVLVAKGGMAFFPREGGAFYGDRRWLTTPRAGDLKRASELVENAGFSSFALVSASATADPPRIGTFEATHLAQFEAFTGVTLTVTTYTDATTADQAVSADD